MSESLKIAVLALLIGATLTVGISMKQRFDALDAQLSVLINATASDSGGER